LYLFLLPSVHSLIHKQNSLNKLTPGIWKFQGHLGNYIDTIAPKRILNTSNWNTIYPETENAFGTKEDDKNYPKSGQ
jgi:hypothetical protein